MTSIAPVNASVEPSKVKLVSAVTALVPVPVKIALSVNDVAPVPPIDTPTVPALAVPPDTISAPVEPLKSPPRPPYVSSITEPFQVPVATVPNVVIAV